MSQPILVDARTGAVVVGRAPATIHWWAWRGWLTPYGERRARRYDLTEIHDTAWSIDHGHTPTRKDTMTTHYRLRDIDNRDGDGAPYETTGTLTALADYIDGPLRSDLTETSDLDLDPIVDEMRSGTLTPDHQQRLREASIYITLEAPAPELSERELAEVRRFGLDKPEPTENTN